MSMPMEKAPPPAPAVDPRLGRVLQDRYKILAPIAAGAMGSVYRAERLMLGRPVAVKFLHAQLANEPLLVKRFEVEARAMSRLAHPNCVAVTDFGVDELPYLVMDFVQGKSLRALIEEGPLPATRAVRIARQILAGLAHAHGQGIIHRDIKPENVLIEPVAGIEDHVRVLDFGLAKFMSSQAKLTQGMTLGTPNYMAPELTKEGGFDERVDLYAAGIVLYEMLAGRPPFQAPDVAEVFLRLLTMAPPPLRQANPRAAVSAELERVVTRSIAKDPAQRFPSAAEMSAALEAVPEATARPRPPPLAADTIVEPLPAFLREQGAAPDSPPKPRAPSLKDLRALLVRVTGSRRRKIAAGAAVALLGSLTLVLALSRHHPRPTLAPWNGLPIVGPPAPAPTAAAPAPAAPAQPGTGAASPDQEIQRLLELRRSEPRNADHAAALAHLYVARHRWSAGLAAARTAARLDPERKKDPALINEVIACLQSDKAFDEASAYLRELGPAALPALRDAAKNHPSPHVRTRAAELVRESQHKPLINWFRKR